MKVLTNHQNLEHFMTTKQLNRQQTRWAEFLSEFNFKISYRLGKESEKPDTLTRLAQNRPEKFNNSCQQHQFQTLLKAKHLDDNIRKALAVIFCTNKVNEIDEIDIVDEVDEVNKIDKVGKNENIVDVRDYINQNLHQHSELGQILEQGSSSTKIAESRIKNLLENLLDKAYQNNQVKSIIAAKREDLWRLPADFTKQGIRFAIENLTLIDNGRGESTRLYVKDKMYVPGNEKLRLFLLQQHHDPPIQSHLGYKAML